MREIKFKSIDKNKRMTKIIQLDASKYRQFTGLKDKNGVGIYEGDILQTEYFKKHGIVHIVEWDSKRNGWSDYDPKDEFEVIGNIYENKGLLKK